MTKRYLDTNVFPFVIIGIDHLLMSKLIYDAQKLSIKDRT